MAEDKLGIAEIYDAPFTKKRSDFGRMKGLFTDLRPSFDAMEDDGTAQDNATNKTIHEVGGKAIVAGMRVNYEA